MFGVLSRMGAAVCRRPVYLYVLWLPVTIALTGASPAGNVADWEAYVTKADAIVVHKSQRLMELKRGDETVRSYKIQLGKVPTGKKIMAGDGRTPEGVYKIESRRENSAYHLALKISYPNDDDYNNARDTGLNPGNQIMIHGLPNGVAAWRMARDWTDGCIAVTNSEIDEIWRLVDDGTRITILP